MSWGFLKTARLPGDFNMAQRLFRVADVFNLKEAGLVIVAADCSIHQLPATVFIGDPIEFRHSDASTFKTTIAGIPLGGGYHPERPFDFSLPRGVDPAEIKIGAEVWLSSEPSRRV